MSEFQSGILADVPSLSRYLFFSVNPGVTSLDSLAALLAEVDGERTVVGIGEPLVRLMGKQVPGLETAPALAGPGLSVPGDPLALWLWLRGDDRGELVVRTHEFSVLDDCFSLDEIIDGFRYREGRDLSGYVDGTENPQGEKAMETAFVSGGGEGLDGSSFVAVQKWQHDLPLLNIRTEADRDDIFGRRISDNEEFDAPASAHVRRTAQENFDPEAFLLRRSMPWADFSGEGLVFVAFGSGFGNFERQMHRMLGHDDGITDALFRFTRPQFSSYFWCPPLKNGRLDLSRLSE